MVFVGAGGRRGVRCVQDRTATQGVALRERLPSRAAAQHASAGDRV